MARFIGALFDEMNSDRAGLDMSLSHQDADGCRAVHCSEIYYDAESEVFMLSVKGRDAPFPWDDIGIGDQYLIVQQLFVRHVADSLYDNLS